MEKGHAIGQHTDIRQANTKGREGHSDDFVLEKSIFNNVFEKDIRRVFIYKKAERLAKAIHLITPAFSESPSLRDRIDSVSVGLVDAAILPSSVARTKLSRELLALSSILSIARSGGLLSVMNTELIARETHSLLQEVAEYEEPRLSFDDAQTLSGIAKKAASQNAFEKTVTKEKSVSRNPAASDRVAVNKGHVKDTRDANVKDRRGSIMSVIRNKGTASIKDISTVIRDVSEKTIQRELIYMVQTGEVVKRGERRWSTYSLA